MKKSNHLMVLEAMGQRGMLDEEGKRQLYAMQKGFEGECEFARLFERLANQDWLLEYDYWFEQGKRMQADFLLLSSLLWIQVDVKNYEGRFEYKNGQCWHNGKLLAENFFANMTERERRLMKIAHKLDTRIQIRSVAVFINEFGQTFFDESFTGEAVCRHQLREFFWSIKNINKMHTSGEANVRRMLDNFRVPYGIGFTGLAPREFGSVWSGILCGECGGRGCERGKYSITCSVCGKDEMLGSVILRHAVELRYLFYNNPEMVTAGNIFALMGGVISIKTIRRHLATRFPLVRQSNTHFYQINI